jgi:hypothetical protein
MSVFHDAETGALITKGIVLAYDNAVESRTEEINPTAATATSGPGSLTGCTRGVKADGTIGAAYAHPSGTRARVSVTKSREDQVRDNFTECFRRDGSVAMTGRWINRNVDTDSIGICGGTDITKDPYFNFRAKNRAGTDPGGCSFFVTNAAKSATVEALRLPGGITGDFSPIFYALKRGATSVADGGTISHGLPAAPAAVVCTPSVSGEMVSVTARAATTFTVAVKKHDNSAGTTQTVYWIAWV